jgi:serine/threonine protein kinase
MTLQSNKLLAPDANGKVTFLQGNTRLTRGAFGEISIAVYEGKHLCVVKSIAQALDMGGIGEKTNPPQLLQSVRNEILALRTLSDGHPNIVTFLGLASRTDPLMSGSLDLIFEYNPIDLYTVIKWRGASLPIDSVLFITREILSSLHHCHSNGIVHRDVTPKNFLLSQAGRVQLCDFGLAKICPQPPEKGESPSEANVDDTKALCTLYYRPPELLLGGAATHASVDMYSCGLVLAEVLTGKPLLAGKSILDQLHRTFQLFGTPNPGKDTWVHQLPDFEKVTFHHYDAKPLGTVIPRASECPPLDSLLRGMLVMDPSQRLDARDALQVLPTLSVESVSALIPTECKSDLLEGASFELCQEKAIALAARKRTFCKAIAGAILEKEMNLKEACQYLSTLTNS